MRFKKILIFLIGLFFIYLGLNFFIVSNFAKDKISKLLASKLNREVILQSFEFNPLTFELKFNGVDIKQKRSIDSFIFLENLIIDIDFKNFKQILIKDITVNSPIIKISMDKNNSFNFDDLLSSNDKDNSNSSFFELGKININNGNLNFTDKTKSKSFNFTKINYQFLGVKNILNFNLGGAKGDIFFENRKENFYGNININGLDISKFKKYYTEFINFEPFGKLSFNTKIAYQDKKLNFQNFTLGLNDIKMRLKNKKILEAKKLQIQNINIDLDKKLLDIGEVNFYDSQLNLIINKDKTINFSNLIKSNNQKAKTEDKKWAVVLRKTDIKNLNLNFIDYSYQTPLKFAINNIGFSLSKFSLDGGKRSDFLINSKNIKIVGEFGLNPIRLNSKISLTNFDVSNLKQFISKQTKLKIGSGKIDLKIDIDYQKELRIKNGNLTIRNLQLLLKKAKLSYIKSLKIRNFAIDLKNQKINIAKIFLDKMKTSVYLSKNGLNLANIMKKNKSKKNGKNWDLIINKIVLSNNDIKFQDKIKKVKFKLSKINIKIDKFSTKKNQKIKINSSAILNSAPFSYKGKIKLSPFEILGRIKLDNFNLKKIQPYISQFLNLQLKSGKFNFSGEITYNKNFKLNSGKIKLNNLIAYQDRLKVLNLNRVVLNNINFQNLNLTISNLILDRVNVNGVINKDGEINFSKISKASKEKKRIREEKRKKLKIKIGEISFTNSKFFLENQQNLSNLDISNINLKIDNFTTQKNKTYPYFINFRTLNSTINLNGYFGLKPLYFNSNLNFSNLDLTALNPYLKPHLNLKINSFNLGLNGFMKFKNDKFSLYGGIIKIKKMDLDGFRNKKLLKSDLIMLNDLEFKTKPNRLKIKKITLKDNYLNYFIFKDGNSSISKIFKNKKIEKKKTKDTFPLNIDKILVSNLNINFQDKQNPLAMKLKGIKGDILNISTTNLVKSYIELDSRINKYGYTRIDAGIYFKNFKFDSDINFWLYNIKLKLFEFYIKKFIGYKIKSGTLIELDSHTKIKNSQINSKSKITVDNLRLKNPTLALKSSLQLIKDTKGLISFPLNLKGDIDNPKFKFMEILSIAFSNILGNIITSPLKLIENILQIKSEKIDKIIFNAGSSNLLPPAIEKLNQLSIYLKKNKRKVLIITNSYNLIKDSEALKKQYIKGLIKNYYDKNKITDILKKEFLKYYSKQDFNYLKYRHKKQILNQNLKKLIKKTIFISEKNLKILAKNRGQNIYKYLLNRGVVKKKLKIKKRFFNSQDEVMTKLEIEYKLFF